MTHPYYMVVDASQTEIAESTDNEFSYTFSGFLAGTNTEAAMAMLEAMRADHPEGQWQLLVVEPKS